MVQEPSFRAYGDRLPPQNIDAEEAILGGILLDPEAITRVSEILKPEAFYITAHQEIYRATLTLSSQGQPTDLLRVTTWLRDQELLDKVGGQSRLIQLVDRTISAVNIDQYAKLVMDKYMRRQLISAGTQITQFGFDTKTPLAQLLDQSEQSIFAVTQSRPTKGLSSTADIIMTTFADIEQLSEGLVLPGIPCGFYDLDAMTQGFQRSDLIIAAARPAMGKCLAANSEIVLADGSITTIEAIYRDPQPATLLTLSDHFQLTLTQPSAYVDDGIKPLFQVKTRLGRQIQTTLSHPYLTLAGWRSLSQLNVGDRVAVPRRIPIMGTQTLRPCEVKLLAYLIGDGCLTDTCPSFTNTNPSIQADFLEAVRAFGYVKATTDENGDRAQTYRIANDINALAARRAIFGQTLRKAILASPYPARYLAQQLKINPSLICAWQNGSTTPNPENFEQLCQILNIPATDLVEGGYRQIAHHNAVTEWLKQLHLWGKNAHEKSIPNVIFQLERSHLALFLNRLFATDGWASVLTSGQAQLGYTTVSETLARQLQHLLLRFGIIAALKHRQVKYSDCQGHHRRSAWQLDITDICSIRNFVDEIKIFGKEIALKRVEAAIAQRQPHTNRDLIPVGIWDRLATTEGDQRWTAPAIKAGLKGTSNLHVGKRSRSLHRLLALATALNDADLQNLANSDVYWDEIVSIEPMGEGQVYDLTIPETHNFVANDICVHNTSFVLNIARNIAASSARLPIAIFSLEMSKEQLVYRLLASEAQVESGRLRSGRLSQHEWAPLSHAIDSLSQIPIYIDDTANISVNEVRSKARRLQAEQGGALGLIMIDYLQLMEGGGDNRVQELSKMTRSLKQLARELNVPIIALSQLSRGVESRTNKRPMMSDLRECVTGDTLVWLADGRRLPIGDLVGQTPEVISMDAQGQLIKAKADLVWQVGTKPIYKITTASGRQLKATAKHRLYTFDGWQQLQTLQVGERIAVANHMPRMATSKVSWPDSKVILLAHLIGDGSYLTHQPLRYTTASEENSAVVKSATEEFGCTVNRHPGKGNWHQLVISGNGNRWHPAGVGRWLKELGIFNQRSAEKHIPAEVFQLPDEQIALLLRHLWATDGCISNYYHPNGKKYKASIFFSTVSEQLARDVMALLLRLHIASQMRWSQSRCYEVHIYGKTHQLEFLNTVGAFGPRVEPAVAAKSELLRRGKANPNRDTIPIQVFDLVKQMMKAQGISQRHMAELRGTSYGGSSHFKFAPSREMIQSYADVLDSSDLRKIANSHIFWDEIVSIEPIGKEPVYDLTVPGSASWMADGIASHNSGSIEQDADLIMMLYRDEYYNPDTPDRGIAEVIITKHRNGPVGTIKLLFEPQFTRFRNLAQPGNTGQPY